MNEISPTSTTEYGPRPELGWLPVAMLSVDEAYQRKIDSQRSKQAIEQITRNFRWSCFGTALVTQTDEGWLLIDGQHRVEAARRLGIKTVPCIVVQHASQAEQAAIFVSTNQGRVQVNPYSLFHARLMAGEELALGVQRLLDEARLSIPRYPIQKSQLKPGQTLALVTLERIVKGGGTAAGTGVIAAGHAYEGRAGAATALILQAAAIAAQSKPDKGEDIRAFFIRHDPDALNMQYRGVVGAGTLSQLIIKSIDAPKAATTVIGSGAIKPPTRDQLMAGR